MSTVILHGPKWRLMLLLLLPGIMLPGCSTVEKAGKSQKRHLQFLSYDHAVRWGDLEEAYAYLKPDEVPPVIPEGLDNIRVTGYELLGPVFNLDENRVSRKVRIEYVLKDRQVVKSLIDNQVWEYDQQNEQWFRVNPLPEFK
jgi:hypothetical protein